MKTSENKFTFDVNKINNEDEKIKLMKLFFLTKIIFVSISVKDHQNF